MKILIEEIVSLGDNEYKRAPIGEFFHDSFELSQSSENSMIWLGHAKGSREQAVMLYARQITLKSSTGVFEIGLLLDVASPNTFREIAETISKHHFDGKRLEDILVYAPRYIEWAEQHKVWP